MRWSMRAKQYGVERAACLPAAGAVARDATLRRDPADDEDALTRAIIALASQYGRYGYRRITALLQGAGWQVGKDRVQRIWRREGLKVPQKQRAARAVVAERWLVRAAAAGAGESRLELRLRQRHDARWHGRCGC